MNKNTIIGFVLIGAVLFGFTWFQSKQYEKQVAYQAQLDSLAAVQAREQYIQDSIAGRLPVAADTAASGSIDSANPAKDYAAPLTSIYKDSLLNVLTMHRRRSTALKMTRLRYLSPPRARSRIR